MPEGPFGGPRPFADAVATVEVTANNLDDVPAISYADEIERKIENESSAGEVRVSMTPSDNMVRVMFPEQDPSIDDLDNIVFAIEGTGDEMSVGTPVRNTRITVS